MDFGDELKRIRESRGMTVNQLAMYSGVSSATISRVENKKRGIPKPNYIRKLAEALKYPYADLMRLAGYTDSNEKENTTNEETELDPKTKTLFKNVEELKKDPRNIDFLIEMSNKMLGK